jgi:hypothetical protein
VFFNLKFLNHQSILEHYAIFLYITILRLPRLNARLQNPWLSLNSGIGKQKQTFNISLTFQLSRHFSSLSIPYTITWNGSFSFLCKWHYIVGYVLKIITCVRLKKDCKYINKAVTKAFRTQLGSKTRSDSQHFSLGNL